MAEDLGCRWLLVLLDGEVEGNDQLYMIWCYVKSRSQEACSDVYGGDAAAAYYQQSSRFGRYACGLSTLSAFEHDARAQPSKY